MANTKPPIDEADRLRGVLARGRSFALARLHGIAACTIALAGERLVEMAALREAGALAFSDDGRPVADASRMRRALEWSRLLGAVIVSHAEEPTLRGTGAMHEGTASGRLGHAGIPAAAETAMVARDLELAALTGGRLHVAHASTARTVEMIREAKRRGLPVTAETAPHYLFYTDADVERLGTAAKMNPPLRTAEDRAALRRGLADGTIDAIATDHAPHAAEDKDRPFADAAFGVVGLETALAAVLTALHHEEGVPLVAVLERSSAGPRRAFGLPVAGLAPGAPADLVALDPAAVWTVEPEAFHTLGRSTPFAGSRLTGRVLGTWIGGRRVFERPAEEAAEGGSCGRFHGAARPVAEPAEVGP